MFCLTVLDQCPQCVWSKGLLTLFPLLPWVALTELLLLVLLPDEAEPFLCLREGPRLGVATRGGVGMPCRCAHWFLFPLKFKLLEQVGRLAEESGKCDEVGALGGQSHEITGVRR